MIDASKNPWWPKMMNAAHNMRQHQKRGDLVAAQNCAEFAWFYLEKWAQHQEMKEVCEEAIQSVELKMWEEERRLERGAEQG